MDQTLAIIAIIIAGPLIGSLLGIIKKPSLGFMYNMLAYAAGVMLAISFLNLIPESIRLSSIIISVMGIIFGSLAMFLADKIIPHIHPGLCTHEQGNPLQKTAYYLLIGIFLHNFPEGIAIAAGTISGTKLSFMIAIAIAIHDIPEGICTSAPYYYISKKRLKSFLVSLATTIPTIIGFVLGYFFFPKISLVFVGFLTAATAGLMIYISSDELIPSSCWKLTNHSTIFSLILGVLSVILLGLL